MDDALPHIEHGDIGHAEFRDVGFQGLHLQAGLLVLDAAATVLGRDVVIGHGERRLRAAHRQAGPAQAVEGLRAAVLVQEMAIDIEHAGAVAETLDDVGVPDLVEQGARLGCRVIARFILRRPSDADGAAVNGGNDGRQIRPFRGNGRKLQALAWRVGVRTVAENPHGRTLRGADMDLTTLLIIVVIVLLLGGGGWYGRGRWY